MERVGTLLQKLQTQYQQQASASQLLLTIRQLQAELQHLQNNESATAGTAVTVDMPTIVVAAAPVVTEAVASVSEVPEMPVATALPEPAIPVTEEEKIVEVLQIDEAEIEAELEEIKRNAALKNNMGLHTKPSLIIDDGAEDIPTLTHQQPKEINQIQAKEGPSINDKLKQASMELGDQLTEASIKDLKKAIGINEQYLYINELFRGDETMYERSIKTINSFSILPEAEYWIQRELKVKLGWNDANETVQQFAQLVKRRFSAT